MNGRTIGFNIAGFISGGLISYFIIGFNDANTKAMSLSVTLLITILLNLWNLRWEQSLFKKELLEELNKLRDSIDFSVTLENLGFLALFRNITTKMSLINMNAKHDFLKICAKRELTNFNDAVNDIESEKYNFSPDDEIVITKELVESPRKSIKAVSYQDIDWWKSPHGKLYLSLQSNTKKQYPSLEITRIFIVNNKERNALKHIFNEHEKLSLKYHIVDVAKVPSARLSDFVIYDDKIVRLAKQVDGTIGKSATLSTQSSVLNDAIKHFQMLLDIAENG